MPNDAVGTLPRLADRDPVVTPEQMAAALVPPPQFADASFASYRPDPDFPSQAEVRDAVERFVADRPVSARRGLFGRRRPAPEPTTSGVYLDGGFGVGKTHLLAAAYHAETGRRTFGTFIEYTALVGALGFQGTVDLLTGTALVCIDEFELDDPGDTMMMTRLIRELAERGTRIAATSNTPPGALGEGRFAAQDFLREIQAMADRFTTLRIDGLDFRRRSIDETAATVDDVAAVLRALPGGQARVTEDRFADLVAHLGTVHPSRYVAMVEGLDAAGLVDVVPFTDQTDALRWVALVDRLYDAQVRLVASGTPLDQVFPESMLSGGYRKKYLRAASRVVALTRA
ncbi:cell division protein ZapE [Curtobacterium sp. MCBD17_034]|uniref:cell division protein ZapE n=1 Tax=unclassified Curtobacterium TaxID=257496 RepID=UPI000DA9D6A2|nr:MULTISPECIES: cell division protein ZapE [unclassified Curtobacterium]PZF60854.1 cell division protein ZapE [Curtobacterium sp. MCBD17_034]PZF66409.1 cell division protein ZapE [Curtobacterium sp. MCBD17_013]PZM40203.1 cell division protein ZapE [Curtobacterium sp. MCBD17_031]WIB64985.1 cell division protein ZapE [Curtobacterium sp. MCBD17_040]WIB68846.1 cell division protein ZapE [Curtobacterium sp. MCBD17_035]